MYPSLMLALLVAAFVAAPAVAAQRYASPTGTGPIASCPALLPCSIVDALNSANTSNGDEVILELGTYNVGATELDLIDGIDVHGIGVPAQTKIVTTANTAVYLGNAAAKLRNVEISHSSGTGQAVMMVQGALERVIAKSELGSGCSTFNGKVTDSICASNRSGGAGVFINNSGSTPHSIILRNVTAIGAGATNSSGIYAGASGAGMTLAFDVKSSIARGTTNDVYASGSGGASTTVTMDHSNFQTSLNVGGATISSSATNSNQTTAPAFISAASGDFHQAPGSPTIDAGAVDGSSGATDIDGEARSNGLAADIGADEYYADVTAPATPTIVGPTNGSATSLAAPTVFGTAEANSTVAVFANNVARGTTTADGSGDWSTVVTPALPEGDFAITATATDAATNTSPASAAVNLKVDFTAPLVSIAAPSVGSTTNDSTPLFRFSLVEANPSTTECRVDGGSWIVCVSNASVAKLADGSHTLSVRHTDTAGNTGSTSATFTVDTTSPQTKIAKKPKREVSGRKVKIVFASNEAKSTFICKLDKRAFRPCESPFVKKVKPGRHKFQVKSVDVAGNVDATPAVVKWRVLAG